MRRSTTCLAIMLALIVVSLTVAPSAGNAQTGVVIREIVVTTNIEGTRDAGTIKQLVINQCGLQVGSALSRESVAAAIKIIWGIGIFSDVSISQELMEDGLRVIIDVDVMQSVSNVTLEGFKEYRNDEILALIRLTRGSYIGDGRVAQIRQTILDMYAQKGFLAATLDIELSPVRPDSTTIDSTSVNVHLVMHEGRKVKIKSINIVGNDNISDKDIKKVMSNTKEDRWYRSGEFKREGYEEDKDAVMVLYKMEGYRDMEIVRDSTFVDPATEKSVLVGSITSAAE